MSTVILEDKKFLVTLSQTRKMPCKSIGLPATLCKTGAKLRKIPGSVCSKCYALKGMYSYPVVRKAQNQRFNQLMRALHSVNTAHRRKYIADFVSAIKPDRYFRWFDSGDLQSVEHLELIAEICRKTPQTKHWLPTHEYGILKKYLHKYDIPKNLIIRVSAAMINDAPPSGFRLTATVAAGIGHACDAKERGDNCGACRVCWDKRVRNIDYPLR